MTCVCAYVFFCGFACVYIILSVALPIRQFSDFTRSKQADQLYLYNYTLVTDLGTVDCVI